MRIVLCLLLCVLALPVAGGAQWWINWRADKPLEWSDFHAKKPRRARKRYAAVTYSKIGCRITNGNTDSMQVRVTAMFNTVKSWKINNRLKPYLLQHEQDHFDIAELYARKLRMRLQKGLASTRQYRHSTMWVRLKWEQSTDQMRRCQHRYDRQTNHSRRRAQQLQWNDRIASELDKLRDYAQP